MPAAAKGPKGPKGPKGNNGNHYGWYKNGGPHAYRPYSTYYAPYNYGYNGYGYNSYYYGPPGSSYFVPSYYSSPYAPQLYWYDD
jgi:hypothetical protein